jgi:hypothetical protein
MTGCPDDGSGGGGSAVGPVPEPEAPETAVNVICEAVERCECDPAAQPAGGCELAIDEQVRQAQGDATAAGLEYDADCMGRLLSSVREIGCRKLSDFTLEELVELSREYQCKVFYGTAEPGEACVQLDELGDSCVGEATCVEALCVASPELVAEGGACDAELDFGTTCEPGTYCFDVDGDGQARCVPIPEAGEACLGAQQLCGAGLACTDGTCVVAPGDGEPCNTSGGSPCREDLQCNLETTVCEPLPVGGEACTFFCAAGFECSESRCVVVEPLVCDVTLYDEDRGG